MDADNEDRKSRREAFEAERAAASRVRNNKFALDGVIDVYDDATRAERERRWTHERLSRRGYSAWVDTHVQHYPNGSSTLWYRVVTDLRCPFDERQALLREVDDEMKAEVAAKRAQRDHERAVVEAEQAKAGRRRQRVERIKDRVAVTVAWVVIFVGLGIAWIIFEEIFLRR